MDLVLRKMQTKVLQSPKTRLESPDSDFSKVISQSLLSDEVKIYLSDPCCSKHPYRAQQDGDALPKGVRSGKKGLPEFVLSK